MQARGLLMIEHRLIEKMRGSGHACRVLRI
jgi:hypothetical protein